MPMETPKASPLYQSPRFRYFRPSSMLSRISSIITSRATAQELPDRITNDYVNSMIAHNPMFLSNFLHGEERRTFYYEYFCSAVVEGNANRVYAIQSNPMGRIDLDKPFDILGVTAMQMAAMSGFSDLLRVLFHFGASANIVDCNGNTALRLALTRSNVHEFRGDGLSDVAMLIGYTQIRTLKTNGLDTFLPADLEKLKEERYIHFVDELKSKYPEFESLQL